MEHPLCLHTFMVEGKKNALFTYIMQYCFQNILSVFAAFRLVVLLNSKLSEGKQNKTDFNILLAGATKRLVCISSTALAAC